jgi:hypothetical protein
MVPYKIEVYQKDGLWCAKTPDKDTFRHTYLTHAIGEIFTRVNAAIQYAPCHLMNVSVEETGKFMMENSAVCNVSIVYH